MGNYAFISLWNNGLSIAAHNLKLQKQKNSEGIWISLSASITNIIKKELFD